MALLKEGDKAPDFKGIDQNSNIITLNNFKGKKLILYFYPKDNTPRCTAEACNLRDGYNILLDKGFTIVGVSPDSKKSHQKFIEKNNLPFSLIADTEKEILKNYDAWGLKKLYGREYESVLRTTYIIDKNGIIEKVFKKVKTKDHVNQILENME
jgi:peroxiredoxin Q/BCP